MKDIQMVANQPLVLTTVIVLGYWGSVCQFGSNPIKSVESLVVVVHKEQRYSQKDRKYFFFLQILINCRQKQVGFQFKFVLGGYNLYSLSAFCFLFQCFVLNMFVLMQLYLHALCVQTAFLHFLNELSIEQIALTVFALGFAFRG